MTTKKRIWTKEELTIAYYIAKWDYNGLQIDEGELVDGVIGRTTKPSLQMQVANFRYLLDIEGYQLEDASEAMKELVAELQNKTVTQIRHMVIDYIQSHGDEIKTASLSKNNNEARIRAKALNEQEQLNHENKLKSWAKFGRRLRKA